MHQNYNCWKGKRQMKCVVWGRGGGERQLNFNLPYWEADRYERETSRSSTVNMLFRESMVNTKRVSHMF